MDYPDHKSLIRCFWLLSRGSKPNTWRRLRSIQLREMNISLIEPIVNHLDLL
jgi:hypothetical protein